MGKDAKSPIVNCPKKDLGRLVVWLHEPDEKPLVGWTVVVEDGAGNTLKRQTTINRFFSPVGRAYADFGKVKAQAYSVYSEGMKAVASHAKSVTVQANNGHKESNPNEKLVVEINTVTPKVELEAPVLRSGLKDGVAASMWVKLSMSETHSSTTYDGNGTLRRSSDGVVLFSDAGCTTQVAFVGNRVAVENAALKASPVTYYARGGKPSDVTLTLTLDEAGSRKFLVVDPPASAELAVQPINTVTPKLALDIDTALNASAGHATPVTVSVSLDQDHPERAYAGDLTLTRSDTKIELYTDAACKTAVAWSGNSLTVANALVNAKQVVTYYLKGTVDGAVDLTLQAGASTSEWVNVAPEVKKPVTVKPCTTVTPRISAEHKVVPVDPRLTALQATGETKAPSDPTSIEVWYTQDKPTPDYPGPGRIRRSNANVELFSDKECTKPLAFAGNVATIPDGKLLEAHTAGTKLRYYVKGVAAGKVDLTFEMVPDVPKAIGVTVGAKVELGAIRLTMELYRWGGTPPALQMMTDQLKVKDGRLLHVQDAGKNHGRAKLVVKKLEATHWPDGTDSFKIALTADAQSGGIKLFDAEWDGAEKALPHSIPRADLFADDVTFWVEGSSVTEDFRHVRLDAGLAPSSGATLRNGDWVRFTVVQIKEVKIEGDAVDAKVQHIEEKPDHYRVFINVLGTDAAGRKVTVTAELTKKIQGIRLHFMLVADKDNGKTANNGIDLPNTWSGISAKLKHKDKAASTDATHLDATTDTEGKAKQSLVLSRFGGDVFWPAAYIYQDLHLAKHVDGDTTDEKKRAPVKATKKLVVWRRLWYQLAYAVGFNPPAPANSVTAYEKVFVDLVAAASTTFAVADAPARTFYPEWQLKPAGADTDVAVVGGHNSAAFFGNATLFAVDAGKPLKANVLVCEHQWDPPTEWSSAKKARVPKHTSLKQVGITSNPSAYITMDMTILKPPLAGGALVVKGSYKKGRSWVTLTDDAIVVEKARADNKNIRVKLPVGAPAPTVSNPVQVKLMLQGADGPYLGESQGTNIMAVYPPTGSVVEKADYQDTVTHELGHSIRQTPKGAQPDEIPEHPFWFQGQGVHCKFDHKKCVMYESGPQTTAIHRYCEKCQPYLLVQEMTKFK